MNKMLMVGTGISSIGQVPILGGGRTKSLSQLIKSMFSKGEAGFAYDMSDMSTLFQDASGTIPVTAAGQPVGLILDKSKGLAYSAELFTKFDSTLSSTLSSTTTPTVVTSTVASGIYGAVINVNFMPEVYKISFAWEGNTTGREMFLSMPDGNNISLGFGVTGTYDKFIRFKSQGGLAIMRSPNGMGQTFTISSVSVKRLLGNHAYQTFSASRPILRQTPILDNELATNGSLTSDATGWNLTGNAYIDSINGAVLNITATTNYPTVVNRVFDVKDGAVYQITAELFGSAASPAKILARKEGFHLINNQTASEAVSSTTHTKVSFLTTGTSTKKLYLSVVVDVANVTSGAFGVRNISVQEITGYRTNQNYLQFDGVDDSLQTNNIDFTVTDKISVFAGVRKLSDAVRGVVLHSGATLPTPNVLGNFGIEAPNFELTGYCATLPATGGNWDAKATNAAPHTAVLSARLWQSGLTKNEAILFNINSTLSTVSGGTTPLLGNYGNLPITIGRRANNSLPFNGHIYSLVGISRLTTNSETIAIEKAIAKATGVTLNV